MSIESTLGFDDFEVVEKSIEEKEAERSAKENAATNPAIAYKKATAWQTEVSPKDKSRLAKFSIGKLNGYEKSKELIAYCKKKTNPEQFAKDIDAMTAQEFADVYGFSELTQK